MNIVERLQDLHKQATKERSHYYVGAVVTEAAAEIIRLNKELNEAKREKEDLSMLVKRLVRQSYKCGLRNKLTDDSMNYINKIGAKCSPMRKLMQEVLSP